MTETWRTIPGLDGYEISDRGRIRSYYAQGRNGNGSAWHIASEPQRILSPQPNGSGYLRVRLADGVRYPIHRLVLLAFHGQPPTRRHQANHLNGNKRDNRADNLEWATRSQNMRHSFRELGREPVSGEQNGRSVLDWDTVETIREQYAAGGHTTRSLAKEYRVSQATIWRVVTGRTWRNTETGGVEPSSLMQVISAVPSSTSPVFVLD